MSPWRLAPNPGRLPNLPPPAVGEAFRLSIKGLPPYKERRFSIRNPGHKDHERFLTLREAATTAMNDRAWVTGPVRLSMSVFAPKLERSLLQYVGGVMDALDGSHGPEFTYLPIVYQDDCQVVLADLHHVQRDDMRYELEIGFLGDEGDECQLSSIPLRRPGSAQRRR